MSCSALKSHIWAKKMFLFQLTQYLSYKDHVTQATSHIVHVLIHSFMTTEQPKGADEDLAIRE